MIVFKGYRLFLIVGLVVYLALVTWLSLMPASNFSRSLISFPGIDKIVHGVMYLILGFITFLLISDLWQKSMVKITLTVFILDIGYGFLMEYLQLWITSSSRSFEKGDVLANCLGVATGILIAHFISPMLLRGLRKFNTTTYHQDSEQ